MTRKKWFNMQKMDRVECRETGIHGAVVNTVWRIEHTPTCISYRNIIVRWDNNLDEEEIVGMEDIFFLQSGEEWFWAMRLKRKLVRMAANHS